MNFFYFMWGGGGSEVLLGTPSCGSPARHFRHAFLRRARLSPGSD